MANRVKRVATGWEPQFADAVDSIIKRTTVMELCEAFFALNPPTRVSVGSTTSTIDDRPHFEIVVAGSAARLGVLTRPQLQRRFPRSPSPQEKLHVSPQ